MNIFYGSIFQKAVSHATAAWLLAFGYVVVMTKSEILPNLIRALPKLLVNLLAPKWGFSLERLQLVECEIQLLHAAENEQGWHDINVSRKAEGVNHFVHLSGIFNGAVSLRLGYFLRGQKKFFVPDVDSLETRTFKTLEPFDRVGVGLSLQKLHHKNSVFVSKELAELNGRKDIFVPNQLLMEYFVHQALALWPQDLDAPRHFLLTFMESVELDVSLEMGTLMKDNALRLWVKQNDRVAIFLKAE